MRRRDIQVGEYYECRKLGQVVTCRIVSKHLFGFLLREWHQDRYEIGSPYVDVYGWVWSCQVIEEWNPF